MGWMEAQARYKDGSTLASQRVEDLIARRVLRGMGFVERQLDALERALHIKKDYDAALWPRTEAVLRTCAFRESMFLGPSANEPGWFTIDTREVNADHKEILTLVPELEECVKPPYPLFFTRVKNTQQARAYYLLRNESDPHGIVPARLYREHAHWVQPPVSFLASVGPWWLTVQEIEHFVSQLPLYKPTFDEE